MMTILFADVAGSVELYSRLGDIEAHRRIRDVLHSMSSLIRDHQGRVIEIVGDEIMCAFEETDNAVNAACAIQEHVIGEDRHDMNVRIGLHCDLTNEENGHPFGDTVNIAARVVALARAGQIMLTEHAFQALSDQNKARSRHFSDVHLKGKKAPCTIHQVYWDDGSDTRLVESLSAKPANRRKRPTRMHLQYFNNKLVLEDGNELLLGRGEQCHLKVKAVNASRIHATLKFSAGKVVLTDRSSNGTFIKTRAGRRATDNSELFVHHDDWTTTCGGVISLGRPFSADNNELIFISCQA